jgi:hypothetical protein
MRQLARMRESVHGTSREKLMRCNGISWTELAVAVVALGLFVAMVALGMDLWPLME